MNKNDKIAFVIAGIFLLYTIYPLIKKDEFDYMALGFGLSSTLVLVYLGIIFSHLLELKPAIEKINKQTVILLEPDAAWIEGTKLIKNLKSGDNLCASNCVSWHNRIDYVDANKIAMENKVHIDRLYADNPENRELAKEHSDWGKGQKWRSYLMRKVYGGELPMLDYILAINKMKQPEWAILWLYNAKGVDTLYGFQITDQQVLLNMMKDFRHKWDDTRNDENPKRAFSNE